MRIAFIIFFVSLFVLSEQRLLTTSNSKEVLNVALGYGGGGGSAWNDGLTTPLTGPIMSVTLYTCTGMTGYVCGITTNYIDDTAAGATLSHGTLSGTATSIVFNTQEHFTLATGYYSTYMNYVTLTTNLGRTISAGTASLGGTYFTQSAKGQVIGWFSGQSGSWMDNLAFNFIGPLAYIVYYSDGGTFELSTVDPQDYPITSFTTYSCTVPGGAVSYICGVSITLSGQGPSVVAGATTAIVSTVTIPAAAQSHYIQIALYAVTLPIVGQQVCGLSLTFTGSGVGTVANAGVLTGNGVSNPFTANYQSFSNGVLFRGFKGYYTTVQGYPSFGTSALYQGLTFQD